MSEPSAKRRKTTNVVITDTGRRITDPRFVNIQSDPRYRLPSKKQKVKLDKRFTTKFRNEDFTRRAKVDRYGRHIENGAEQKRLKEKFDLDEDEDDSDVANDDNEVQVGLAHVERNHDPLREGKKHDPLREGKDVSLSDEDSSTDEESETGDEEVEATELAAEEKEDVPLGEVSARIAVVNLDWDNIRATDLTAVFSSFVPTGGRILKVAVYPSEFGKERIEREEMEGPPKEIFAKQQNEDEDDPDSGDDLGSAVEHEDEEELKASIIKPDNGSEFDTQALRQYQLERLRYFYAVLTFSTKETAKAVYDAVDGTEYLSTANFFDLRFIPEDMDFSDDKPRDACERLPTNYKPNEFVTDALQHSKVKLTWDAEDRTRNEAQARAFKGGRAEIDENDLKAYLGSDSDSDDEQGSDQEMADAASASTFLKKEQERQKARALLGLGPEPAKKSASKNEKNGPVGNVQVTFSSGLSGAADNANGTKRSVFENSPELEETTMEKYIRKEKERKAKRKEKMKAPKSDADVDKDTGIIVGDTAVNEDSAEVGFNDPFFEEGGDTAKAASKLHKEERLKKRREREAEEAASAKQRAELELLMADDDAETAQASGVAGKGRTVQHFDMAEIEKAERKKGKKDKWAKKKENKRNRGKRTAGPEKIVQDNFKMDTSDPRFGKLFENHEFAIDPTNAKLRQTRGMKELTEEVRKRKDKGDSRHGSVDRGSKEKKKGNSDTRSGSNRDVRDLVAKLKRKAS